MVKVAVELFYGNSHTTYPEWIKAFQERDYKILSVIMNTKLETCINRVLIKRDNRFITVLQKNMKSFTAL